MIEIQIAVGTDSAETRAVAAFVAQQVARMYPGLEAVIMLGPRNKVAVFDDEGRSMPNLQEELRIALAVFDEVFHHDWLSEPRPKKRD